MDGDSQIVFDENELWCAIISIHDSAELAWIIERGSLASSHMKLEKTGV